MDKQTLQERLDLLTEARAKVEKMKVGSAFVTDFQACRLLARLLEGYQDLMAENLKLQKLARVHAIAKKLKKKALDSPEKGS